MALTARGLLGLRAVRLLNPHGMPAFELDVHPFPVPALEIYDLFVAWNTECCFDATQITYLFCDFGPLDDRVGALLGEVHLGSIERLPEWPILALLGAGG